MTLKLPLRDQLARARKQHEADRKVGAGYVALLGRLREKLGNAARSWPWQWVFPATRSYTDCETGERRRHFLHESTLQRAFHHATLEAGLTK
ncbi:MAG: integron integrase, partial [Deltaproteobacteria bacterium]|nr:integron integrase [Deltaproteobacteria bacterium]